MKQVIEGSLKLLEEHKQIMVIGKLIEMLDDVDVEDLFDKAEEADDGLTPEERQAYQDYADGMGWGSHVYYD